MKTVLTISASLSLIVLVAGCQFGLSPASTINSADTTNLNNISNDNTASDVTYWVDYAIPQCESKPWGNSLEPEVITAYYENTLNITVYAVEVTPPAEGVLFCQACGCPTGITVSIQTDAPGRAFLLGSGFTEATADVTTTTPVPNVAADTQSSDSNTPVSSESASVTNVAVEVTETNTNIKPIPTDAIAEEVALSAEDVELQQRVEQVQTALADYYAAHGSYPNDLAALTLTVETGDLVYTPIGSLPADYYDLVVPYSTGQITVNP